MKTILEFNGQEGLDVKLCIHRYVLWSALNELENYRRELYKYEERTDIPKEEVIRVLDNILGEYRGLCINE